MKGWENVEFFTPNEFGTGVENVSLDLVYLLDRIRRLAKTAIVVHCAWAKTGHSANSWHYKGLACDFHFTGLTYLSQYCLMREFRDIGGLGFYPEWNHPGWHVDLRPGFLQWVQRSNEYHYGWQNFVNEFKK